MTTMTATQRRSIATAQAEEYARESRIDAGSPRLPQLADTIRSLVGVAKNGSIEIPARYRRVMSGK